MYTNIEKFNAIYYFKYGNFILGIDIEVVYRINIIFCRYVHTLIKHTSIHNIVVHGILIVRLKLQNYSCPKSL